MSQDYIAVMWREEEEGGTKHSSAHFRGCSYKGKILDFSAELLISVNVFMPGILLAPLTFFWDLLVGES